MEPNGRHLLISNPPHGEVDPAGAAHFFGLAAVEVRMKANYGLPEIWFVDEDADDLLDTAAGLEGAGLNTVLVAGSDLAEVPGLTPSDWFEFTSEGLQVERDGEEFTLAYDAPAVGVFCLPKFDGRSGKALAQSVRSDSTPGSGLFVFLGCACRGKYRPRPHGLGQRGSARCGIPYRDTDGSCTLLHCRHWPASSWLRCLTPAASCSAAARAKSTISSACR